MEVRDTFTIYFIFNGRSLLKRCLLFLLLHMIEQMKFNQQFIECELNVYDSCEMDLRYGNEIKMVNVRRLKYAQLTSIY